MLKEEWNLHCIIGVHLSEQGWTQTIPDDMLLCHTCGWMTTYDYHFHVWELFMGEK